MPAGELVLSVSVPAGDPTGPVAFAFDSAPLVSMAAVRARVALDRVAIVLRTRMVFLLAQTPRTGSAVGGDGERCRDRANLTRSPRRDAVRPTVAFRRELDRLTAQMARETGAFSPD